MSETETETETETGNAGETPPGSPSAAAAAATKETAAPTTYLILTSEDGGKTWVLEGKQESGNRDTAKTKFFADGPPDGKAVVAVPESSFRPTVPETKEVPKTTWDTLELPV